jgi:hypothetical protein
MNPKRKYTKRMRGGQLRRNVGTRKLSINMNINSLIQRGSSKYEELFSRYYALERRGARLPAPPAKPRRIIPVYNNNFNKSMRNAKQQEAALWKSYIENLSKYEQVLAQEESKRPVNTHHNRFIANINNSYT